MYAIGDFKMTDTNQKQEIELAAFVGIDWADQKHAWALQISGVGTLLTGVNFVTTILKIRAPGMSYMRMPIFCWTALASNLIMLAAFRNVFTS